MMMQFKFFKYLYLILFLFASCEKVITLPIEINDSKVIIEANITDQPGPYFVKLSKSISINEPNIYPIINNSTIIIADDKGVKDTLKHTTGGIYKAFELQSKQTIVTSASGANVEVKTSEILDAKVRFGGNIYYKGTPEVLKTKKVIGGVIKDKN